MSWNAHSIWRKKKRACGVRAYALASNKIKTNKANWISIEKKRKGITIKKDVYETFFQTSPFLKKKKAPAAYALTHWPQTKINCIKKTDFYLKHLLPQQNINWKDMFVQKLIFSGEKKRRAYALASNKNKINQENWFILKKLFRHNKNLYQQILFFENPLKRLRRTHLRNGLRQKQN